jgi:hypothetical protein
MITMVTDFRSKVVKFIFGGRNSGQQVEQIASSDLSAPTRTTSGSPTNWTELSQ